MRASVPEKLLRIAADIAAHGNVPLTRLTVLKKWFERPGRLPAFAVWVASQASSRKGKAGGEAAQLFEACRTLLAGVNPCNPSLDRAAARALHDRLKAFQNEYQNQQWGAVRIVRDWQLLIVEEGLAIYLWHGESPAQGYKLAADYCQHYDPRYGNGLNGPAAAKIKEMTRFILTLEALAAPSPDQAA